MEAQEITQIDELYHRFALASRFNCVEGIILKNIIFNFHRKFFATLIPPTRREWKTRDDVDGAVENVSPSVPRPDCLCCEIFLMRRRKKKVRNSWHRKVRWRIKHEKEKSIKHFSCRRAKMSLRGLKVGLGLMRESLKLFYRLVEAGKLSFAS